ncbi:hypothetical protein MMC13_008258 [Lambiella insularis]|nr:hypothetical protein [Lambiella insularis]
MSRSLLLLAVGALLALYASPAVAGQFVPTGAKNVVVQLFEWPWDSIAQECTGFLGPNGYAYVQTSPAQEHITGTFWYDDYQPVSYNLTSRRGNRQQFAAMVSTCHAAGVGIIVDVLLNDMTIDPAGGVGIDGSPYTKYSYPAVPYTAANFHYCAGNGVAVSISNYQNRTDAQFCEEGGLADLAQEQPAVQQILAAYLQDLQSLGVAGFRVDSAVQQPASNLSAIFATLPSDWWATFEVDSDAQSAVQQSEYWSMGATMAFMATRLLVTAFENTGIASLVTPTPVGPALGSPAYPPSDLANWFVANHDTERYGSSLSRFSPNNAFVLANLFILAFNYGTPEVFSGYNFSLSNTAQGAPQDATTGLTDAVTCFANGWTCEHRFPAISNMVGFHNAVAGAALGAVVQGSSQQIAFGRGAIGFIAINNDANVWSQSFQTGLPAGTYCDVIHDSGAANATCTVASVTVDASGMATLSVNAYDAVAIYKH